MSLQYLVIFFMFLTNVKILYTSTFPVHGSGGGGGGSLIYNTATPMPCDCFETVVKSCYLSYFPVVGCAISASSLAGASTVGIFSYV